MQDGDYNTINRLKINHELSDELEGITKNYIKYLLEREIKSDAWLETLRQQAQKG